jgi:hypothetical protein
VPLTVRVIALIAIACVSFAAAIAFESTHHASPARTIAIVGHTAVTTRDVDLARRALGGATPRATVVTMVVSDAVLVDEARRLRLLGGLSLRELVLRPDLTAVLNQRLYGFAARLVPLPANRAVRTYAKLVADAQGEDADAIADGVGGSEAALVAYDDWLTTRDRVASAWFGRLFARYKSLTTYPTAHA